MARSKFSSESGCGGSGRVLSRIYRLGEKSRVAEGHELPRVVQGHAASPKFLK